MKCLTPDWPQIVSRCLWRPIGSFHMCPGKQTYRTSLVLRFSVQADPSSSATEQNTGSPEEAGSLSLILFSQREWLIYYKYTRKMCRGVKPHLWQRHRSMLFPAFAKIPNSPYLIKRLCAQAPPADLWQPLPLWVPVSFSCLCSDN